MAAVIADELQLLIRAEVGDAISGLKKVEEQAGKSSKKIGDKMKNAGKKATTFLTLPLLAAGYAAVSAATDAQESWSKAETVFGDSFDTITEKANSTADALSQAAFLDAAGTMGNILQALKFTKEESAAMSVELMGLAQDFSSFNNVPVEQAVSAITSALTGEREALKSLGVVINQQMIDQKAMEMGLWDGEEAMSAQAKALATQALIFEGAGAAVGDFERTQDGLANQQKVTTANIKDMLAVMGQRLMPIVETLVGWVKQAVEWFTNMDPALQTVILVVAGVVAVIGPLLIVVGMLIPAIAALIPIFAAISLPVLGVVAAIAAAIAIGILIWKNWDKIFNFLKDLVDTVWTWIQDKIIDTAKDIWDSVVDVYNNIKDAVVGAWEFMVGKVTEILNAIRDVISAVFETVKGIVQAVWSWISENIIRHIVNIFDAISAVMTDIWNVISTVFGFIKGVFDFFMSIYLSVVRFTFLTIKEAIASAIDWVWDKIETVLALIKIGWEVVWGAIKDFVAPIWTAISDTVSSAIEAVKAVIDTVMTAIKTIIGTVMDWIKDKVNTAVGAVRKVWDTTWGFIKDTARAVSGWVTEYIVNPVRNAFDTVKGFVTDLWTKFRDKFNDIKDTVTDVFGNIASAMKDGFKGAVNWMIDKLNWAIDKINGLIRGANKLPGVNINTIPNIPNLGFGGMLNQGGLVRVGDRGRPEVVNLPAGASVTPLRGSGGGGEQHLHFHAPQNDPLGVAREVGWQLMKRGA